MTNIKDLENEINQVSSLRELTDVFGEIASTRMRRIRGYVLKNREFLKAIDSIFRDTLDAYTEKLSQLVAKRKAMKGGKVTFLAHNGKTVSVLISANTGFFGNVVKETFGKFIEDVRREDVEVTIIGKVGRSLFLSAEPNRPYVYFDLPDYGIDKSKLSEVIRHLVQYEEIKVYYGKFETLATQKPDIQDISAGATVGGKIQKPEITYLFEPSVEEILMFFETQIFTSLFDQSLRESQLAKYASRILAMDRAAQNIENRIRELKIEKLSVAHKTANQKQLNSLGPTLYLR
jgi:ATP synthase F1 gamma subunit